MLIRILMLIVKHMIYDTITLQILKRINLICYIANQNDNFLKIRFQILFMTPTLSRHFLTSSNTMKSASL